MKFIKQLSNMEIKASARFIRMSPRKVRLVSDIVRGMGAEGADVQLQFIKKAATKPILKLLRSAMANAEHNFKLDRHNLFIKKITVDGGPTIKRFRARAFGRAAPIRKRSCHINIVLDEQAPQSGTSSVKELRKIKELKAKS